MSYPEFVKYGGISHIAEIPELLDSNVEIYEKLDGGNSQIRKSEGRTLAGNRSKFLTDRDQAFEWFQQFKRWAAANYSLYSLSENSVVFGEWLSKHTLNYDSDKKDKFYFVDFFDLNSRKFIPYDKSKILLDNLGIKDVEFLRPLFKGNIGMRDLEKLIERKSDYRDGRMEGVVIKDYNSQRFAKLLYTSVHRKKHFTYEDVSEIITKLIESGIQVNESSILKEISTDFSKQKIPFRGRGIEKVVHNYLSGDLVTKIKH